MSLAKDKIWKLLAPLVVMGVVFLVPVPGGMSPQTWHYLAVFVAMIVDMISEPIPAIAISFIAVTICVIGSNYLLFDAPELTNPAFKVGKQVLKWGLAGSSSTTVWLVLGAFIFVLGYEVTGLGRRITLFLMKFMGKRTLMLGYVIAITDTLLAPLTPPNTARTDGTVLPVIKNLLSLPKSFLNDPSARRIGGCLMWMMIISTSLSSSMFVTGTAPNVLGLEFVNRIAGTQISWLQWFLSFLPVGTISLVVAPWLLYVPYKPEVTHSAEVAAWAGDELKGMGKLTRKEIALVGPVPPSLGLWVFGDKPINTTAVSLLAVSLMLALHVVPWKDITRYNSAWNILVNLITLVVMANGLTRSGLIDWLVNTMSTHLEDFSPNATAIVLVLVFYLAHYLFASLSAHTVTMLPVILAADKGILGVPVEHLCVLLVLSIGIVGCLTPYVTGPGVITYDCGYVKLKDYWRLGAISGVIYIFMLLLVGWPVLAMWD